MGNDIDPRDVFLKGKITLLKVLTKKDVLDSNWYGWFNDEELCKTLQNHYYPNSVELQLEFWGKNIYNSDTKIQFGICKIDDPKILGIKITERHHLENEILKKLF